MTGALIPKVTSCRASPPLPIPTTTTVQTSTTRNTKIYTKIYTQFPSQSQNCCDYAAATAQLFCSCLKPLHSRSGCLA